MADTVDDSGHLYGRQAYSYGQHPTITLSPSPTGVDTTVSDHLTVTTTQNVTVSATAMPQSNQTVGSVTAQPFNVTTEYVTVTAAYNSTVGTMTTGISNATVTVSAVPTQSSSSNTTLATSAGVPANMTLTSHLGNVTTMTTTLAKSNSTGFATPMVTVTVAPVPVNGTASVDAITGSSSVSSSVHTGFIPASTSHTWCNESSRSTTFVTVTATLMPVDNCTHTGGSYSYGSLTKKTSRYVKFTPFTDKHGQKLTYLA